MKLLIAPTLILTASVLASCTPAPVTSTLPAPTTPAAGAAVYANGADPDFAAKCVQRIRAGLSTPNAAEIALSGDQGGDLLQANVTTTNPDNGEKTRLEYVCKRDQDRAVTAKLISD